MKSQAEARGLPPGHVVIPADDGQNCAQDRQNPPDDLRHSIWALGHIDGSCPAPHRSGLDLESLGECYALGKAVANVSIGQPQGADSRRSARRASRRSRVYTPYEVRRPSAEARCRRSHTQSALTLREYPARQLTGSGAAAHDPADSSHRPVTRRKGTVGMRRHGPDRAGPVIGARP